MRHLGHQVGGGGRDQHQIAIARQPDMPDILLILPGKEIGEDMVCRKRTDGKRGHELLRTLRHDRTHGSAAFPQAADEIEALVGRDAACDDEKDAFAAESHGFSRRFFDWAKP